MYVAFDDTDSVDGMCTTFLTTELIRQSGLDVIGYPKLVRLNPNIGYKTRGNGAVVVRLGKGFGETFPIGEIDGNIINANKEGTEVPDHGLADLVSGLVQEYSAMGESKTNPGFVISHEGLNENFYMEALRKEVSPISTEKALMKLGVEYRKFKNGRGIVGSTAALGWKGRRKTYEILAYDYPKPKKLDRKLQMDAASFVEENYSETFNNLDLKNRDAAIFPSNRTPVVYGVKSIYPSRLMEISRHLSERFGIGGTRNLIYETNQGTDDHILYSPDRLWETGSFALKGEIQEVPAPIRGGHYFTWMKYRNNVVKLAAFEPTKEFRSIFRELRPGDMVEAAGSYVDNTLNVEKMKIITTSRYFRRVPPFCSSCGKQMKTHGKNDYRCRYCHIRSATPGYSEEKRIAVPGRYEVPVCARRHLSMPFRIEPYWKNPEAYIPRREPA